MSDITIPKSVIEIGTTAFANCSRLLKVTFLNRNTLFPTESSYSDPFLGCQYLYTIKGESGSSAQKYANLKNKTFIALKYDSGVSAYTNSWSNNSIELNISVNGYENAPKPGILYIAFYDKDDNLLEVYTKAINLSFNNLPGFYSTYTVNTDIAYKYKIYFWNNFEERVPLASPFEKKINPYI